MNCIMGLSEAFSILRTVCAAPSSAAVCSPRLRHVTVQAVIFLSTLKIGEKEERHK